MREELLHYSDKPGYVRITPAHAGRINYTHSTVHYLSGSPPRMREEFRITLMDCVVEGITPAHAGRILSGGVVSLAVLDHPRACGKNAAMTGPTKGPAGSPPRMREEFNSSIFQYCFLRITPAHAGRIFTASAFIVAC